MDVTDAICSNNDDNEDEEDSDTYDDDWNDHVLVPKENDSIVGNHPYNWKHVM